MIFRALACDYDGTIASQDRITPAALGALAEARRRGLRLVLVTGRSFFELTRVCDVLDLFDVAVAENGGVLFFPGAGTILDLGPHPPVRFLAELSRRGIHYEVGRVVVGTARRDEGRVREALAACDVGLEPVANRAALMLLPPGVSKGGGVSQAIRLLGLSPHDVLAVGDAENDLSLFGACGWTACPADAVPELREQADWIFPGSGPDGVAAGLARVLTGGFDLAGSRRHRLVLGWAPGTGNALTIPERGVNVLVHGDPTSGKSWLAGALVERLHARRYGVCVLDPEGDYRVLGDLPGVVRLEVRRPGDIVGLADVYTRDASACVVVDLTEVRHDARLRLVEDALERLAGVRRRAGPPHWVVVDEAHYWLRASGVAEASVVVGDGGLCLATYRGSELRPSLSEQLTVFLLARTTEPRELAYLRGALGRAPELAEHVVAALPVLPRGEFIVVQPNAAGRLTAATIQAPPRQTPHVRHRSKYADTPVAGEHRFLFRDAGGRVVAEARSLQEFAERLWELPAEVFQHHAARGDFSRWVADVFSDRALAQQIRKTEGRFHRGEVGDPARAIRELIESRYGV
jgi:hypothetical protein